MTSRYPGAYGLSALLHGGVIALVLFFSYAATSVVKDEPKILELVAGSGDNYAATEAPALGSPGGVKLQATPVARAPSPPQPKALPAPIQDAPEPVPTAAKPAAAKPTKTVTPKPVDLVASLKKAEERREKRMEAKYEKQREAELKKEAAAAKADAKVAHIDAEGIREGVLGGSAANKTGGAGGNALTREEGSELEAYFQMLTNRVRENAVPIEGVSDTLEARVEFMLAADGSISHVRILKSSGNAEFDNSALEAVAQTRSIGPRPDGRSDTRTMLYKLHNEQPP
jgi:colicin import membrane protein